MAALSLLAHHIGGPLICIHKPKGTDVRIRGLSFTILMGYFTLPFLPQI